MTEYQVIARKYRPQTFKEVLGQEAIVTTLKNAIKFNRMAHAYLFCGSRGTGKTTLARIFAKALNCQNPQDDFEPCGRCSSCREIAAGHSLDVMEIDGASNRGIDDIRQINDRVGYASASGKYKIYIIDEVHMLTKEAFNALLKTLEEPPPKVKFFFATTEPHKVLPTILSRCQRFNLNRIPTDTIVGKLQGVSQDLGVKIEPDALRLIANRADGGLRDAESLFDQILAFHDGEISEESVASILGVMGKDCFFDIDRAGKEGNFAFAFEVVDRIFSQGKDLSHFIEGLIEHFRHLVMMKLVGRDSPLLSLSAQERAKYEHSAKFYSQEQCLTNLDYLIEAQNQMRHMPSPRIAVEAILLRVMRSHQRLPIEFLVRRLSELEQSIGAPSEVRLEEPPAAVPVAPKPIVSSQPQPQPQPQPQVHLERPAAPVVSEKKVEMQSSYTEDPTPSLADLGIRAPVQKKVETPVYEKSPAPIDLGARPTEEAKRATAKSSSRHDTILHFAAVELEGTIQKK